MLLSTARALVKTTNGGAARKQDSVKNLNHGAKLQDNSLFCMVSLLVSSLPSVLT